MRLPGVIRRWWLEIVMLVGVFVVFVIPFIFMLLTAAKDRREAAKLELSLPTEWHLLDNVHEVLGMQDGIMGVALVNSLLLYLWRQ